MTDTLLDYDPSDTGEIPPPVGETRIRIDTGEKTQRIDPRIVAAPSFDAIPRKVIDLDDTVTFHIPQTIGVVDLEGPQKPPPLLPKPTADPAETGANIFGGLGADLPEPQPGAQPWPVAARAGARVLRLRAAKAAWWRGLWTGLAIGVGVGVAIYAGQVLAAGVVIW